MRQYWCAMLILGLLSSGCNIFGIFHEDGSSDDPEVLQADAKAALHNDEPNKALTYAKKGIANDPSLDFPYLRYFAAQAVLSIHDIKISTFMEMLSESEETTPKVTTPGGSAGALDEIPLFDLTEAELADLAEAFPEVIAYLDEIIQGVQNSVIPKETVDEILLDVEQSYGVGNLLIGFLTALDQDHDLDNGFNLDPDLDVFTDASGGYQFTYTGDLGGRTEHEFIKQEIVEPNWYRFITAQEALFDAYKESRNNPDLPEDLPYNAAVGQAPIPGEGIDTSTFLGKIFDFVHTGITELYNEYGPLDDPTAKTFLVVR